MTDENHCGGAQPVIHDAGLAALVMIARFHGIAADPQQLRHASGVGGQRFDETRLVLSARTLGLKVRAVTVGAARLKTTPLPALALARDGSHFLLAACDGTKALTMSPGEGGPVTRTPEEVVDACDGRLLLFASRASLAGELARFDFTWFIPAIVKYRRLLLEVLAVSFLLQIFIYGHSGWGEMLLLARPSGSAPVIPSSCARRSTLCMTA